MKKQLDKWIGYTECHPFPYPVNRYGTKIELPTEATADGKLSWWKENISSDP